ncbi:hypothetical protein CYY_002310 [Polysphondylium violaceum]|uniref:Uncharacterized protein n=1 Tax=Polysphondylium violaceum TaxID=133409 RepID=A0A8J4PZD3_9MYCE|nr:hypothetical protein CYY_002310 [Polysphondylium violaceum]
MDMEDQDIDHDMIAYELLQMQNESYWLIKTEVPTVCKRVKRILNKCIDFLKPLEPVTEQEEDKDKDAEQQDKGGVSSPNITSTTTKKKEEEIEDFEVLTGVEIQEDTNEVLKDSSKRFETLEGSRGIVNLNGWMVDSQEFVIKFLKQPHHKSNQPIPTYKTSIQKENPWRIQQIQNSYNHLGFIIAELDNIISFSENFVPPSIYNLPTNGNVDNNENSNSSNNSNSSKINDSMTGMITSTTDDNASTTSTTSTTNLNQSNEYINAAVAPPLSSSQTFIPTPNNIKAIQNSSVVRSPELISLVENIKSISEWLSMAKEELLLPSRNIFPSTLYLPNVLQPPLPFEINVDISLSNCDLLISIHELQISSVESTPSSSSRFSPNNDNSPSKFLRRSSTTITSNNSTALSSSSSSLPSSQSNTPSKSSPIHSSAHHNNQSSQNLSNGKGDQNNSGMGQRNSSNPNLLSLSTGNISVNGNGSLSPTSSSLALHHHHHHQHHNHLYHGDNGETLYTPDYMKKPFQTNKGGSLQWINVINHTEARIPMRQLSDSFALLTSAYDKLADLSEKFMVISNIN